MTRSAVENILEISKLHGLTTKLVHTGCKAEAVGQPLTATHEAKTSQTSSAFPATSEESESNRIRASASG
jgi:hypothetical protein